MLGSADAPVRTEREARTESHAYQRCGRGRPRSQQNVLQRVKRSCGYGVGVAVVRGGVGRGADGLGAGVDLVTGELLGDKLGRGWSPFDAAGEAPGVGDVAATGVFTCTLDKPMN